MKICISCNLNKNLSEYHFRKDTNKYRNQCKTCRNKYVSHYKRTNDDHKIKYNLQRKNRRLTDIDYCMRERYRGRIRATFSRQNVKKHVKSFSLLGCDFETFKKHIINNFYGNMEWDKKNFVLDHRVPCSWFDLSKDNHAKICFNYKNIFPMKDKDNLIKSDKIWINFNLNKNPYI